MELKELFTYRKQILEECKDADGFLSDNGFLQSCLPWLNETKFTDTTDVTDIYCLLDKGTIKVNAYTVNESEERLQLFIVNDNSLNIESTEEDLMISQKWMYDKQFARTIIFLKKSIKRQLDEYLQDADPAWVLVHQLATSVFVDQIDVVEIFLLTATITVEQRGTAPSAKTLDFEDELISVNYSRDKEKYTKDLIIKRRLIDLNLLYNVHVAQGSRHPLFIDFTIAPFQLLPCLHAASEETFDSYLCAIPATLLAELYKHHSSRLLEKNVRSFLQLKNSVNKGMQDTIRKDPQKFIAYNNGLTITATKSELLKIDGIPNIKSLTDFQIVNGGQTTATIYFSHKLGLNIEPIRIMAKINVAKDANDETLDELISNISTYSNAQSKVSKVDLRARSSQLVKLKSLSDSILTASGKKWFFERAKGEYATMLRINSGKKAQIERAFPKDRRFTKEELAKYYAAWGDSPYAVKKGGEKIFRMFIEDISGEGKSKKSIAINRYFYEDLISRIILFRSLEAIYGIGNSAMGQLRSAVVPYSISILYGWTNGNRKMQSFDLLKIWKSEKLEDDLNTFFVELMKLMNDLIKQYAKSDDVGENAKKIELWENIKESKEIAAFMEKAGSKQVIKKYSISEEALKKREKENSKIKSLDFTLLIDAAAIFDKGVSFYRYILRQLDDLPTGKKYKLENIIAAIDQCLTPEESYLNFEKEFLNQLVVTHPFLLDKVGNTNNLYLSTVNFIIKKYNSAIEKEESVLSVFNLVKEIAQKKGIQYASVYGEIGRILEQQEMPTMRQIRQASAYVKDFN